MSIKQQVTNSTKNQQNDQTVKDRFADAQLHWNRKSGPFLKAIDEFATKYDKLCDESDVLKLVPNRVDRLKKKDYSICVYGTKGAGKSTLLNFLLTRNQTYPLVTGADTGHVTLFSLVVKYDENFSIDVVPADPREGTIEDDTEHQEVVNKCLGISTSISCKDFKDGVMQIHSILIKLNIRESSEGYLGLKERDIKYIVIKGPWKSLENHRDITLLDIKGVEDHNPLFGPLMREFKPTAFLFLNGNRIPEKELMRNFLHTYLADQHVDYKEFIPICYFCKRLELDRDVIRDLNAKSDVEQFKDVFHALSNEPNGIQSYDFDLRSRLFDCLMTYCGSIVTNQLDDPDYSDNFLTQITNRLTAQDVEYISTRVSLVLKVISQKNLFSYGVHTKTAEKKWKKISERNLKTSRESLILDRSEIVLNPIEMDQERQEGPTSLTQSLTNDNSIVWSLSRLKEFKEQEKRMGRTIDREELEGWIKCPIKTFTNQLRIYRIWILSSIIDEYLVYILPPQKGVDPRLDEERSSTRSGLARVWKEEIKLLSEKLCPLGENSKVKADVKLEVNADIKTFSEVLDKETDAIINVVDWKKNKAIDFFKDTELYKKFFERANKAIKDTCMEFYKECIKKFKFNSKTPGLLDTPFLKIVDDMKRFYTDMSTVKLPNLGIEGNVKKTATDPIPGIEQVLYKSSDPEDFFNGCEKVFEHIDTMNSKKKKPTIPEPIPRNNCKFVQKNSGNNDSNNIIHLEIKEDVIEYTMNDQLLKIIHDHHVSLDLNRNSQRRNGTVPPHFVYSYINNITDAGRIKLFIPERKDETDVKKQYERYLVFICCDEAQYQYHVAMLNEKQEAMFILFKNKDLDVAIRTQLVEKFVHGVLKFNVMSSASMNLQEIREYVSLNYSYGQTATLGRATSYVYGQYCKIVNHLQNRVNTEIVDSLFRLTRKGRESQFKWCEEFKEMTATRDMSIVDLKTKLRAYPKPTEQTKEMLKQINTIFKVGFAGFSGFHNAKNELSQNSGKPYRFANRGQSAKFMKAPDSNEGLVVHFLSATSNYVFCDVYTKQTLDFRDSQHFMEELKGYQKDVFSKLWCPNKLIGLRFHYFAKQHQYSLIGKDSGKRKRKGNMKPNKMKKIDGVKIQQSQEESITIDTNDAEPSDGDDEISDEEEDYHDIQEIEGPMEENLEDNENGSDEIRDEIIEL